MVVQRQEGRVREFRGNDLLLFQLPAEGRESAFVFDRSGRIISAEGLTKMIYCSVIPIWGA